MMLSSFKRGNEMNRLFFVILSLFTVTGCSLAPLRTGSIVVDKFSIDSYKTSNPVSIKKDVAEHVRDGLQREILRSVMEDSKLSIANSCDHADYRLVGTIKEIN